MKKLKAMLLIVASIGMAGICLSDNSRKYTYVSDIGPTVLTTTLLSGVTISTVTSTRRNCLEYATFYSSSATTIYILDSGTTDYTLNLAAGAIHQAQFNEPFCGGNGNSLILRSSATTSGASYSINYMGFVGQ